MRQPINIRPYFSNRRLVIAGDFMEYYIYDKDYAYGLSPAKNSGGRKRPPDKSEHLRKDNLSASRRRLRRIVNSNPVRGFRPLFFTLTFADNIQDLAYANYLFKKFRQKFQYRFGRRKYLAVPEFQKRGAIHYHIIFFDIPYTDNLKPIIRKLWSYGFIKIQTLQDIEFIGTYISKYLSKETDRKLYGKKKYFGSRNLFRPIEFRKPDNVDNFICNFGDKKLLLNSAFEYKGGSVAYWQYKKC